jgi:hypothetical protein
MQGHLNRMAGHLYDLPVFVEADAAFHRENADGSGNQVLQGLLQSIRSLLRVWVDRALTDESQAPAAPEEHNIIFLALKARDKDAVTAAIQPHMETASRRLLLGLDASQWLHTGVLVHRSGALTTLVMSFNAVKTNSLPLKCTGSAVRFQSRAQPLRGDVRVLVLGATEWETLPLSGGYVNSGRRYGITDLATTPHGEEPRAGGHWPSTHWKSWKAYSIRPDRTGHAHHKQRGTAVPCRAHHPVGQRTDGAIVPNWKPATPAGHTFSIPTPPTDSSHLQQVHGYRVSGLDQASAHTVIGPNPEV